MVWLSHGINGKCSGKCMKNIETWACTQWLEIDILSSQFQFSKIKQNASEASPFLNKKKIVKLKGDLPCIARM